MTVTLLGERLRAQAQAQAKNAALARLVEFGTSTNLPESANTERQTLKDFYEAVLPAQGCYCLTLLPAGQHLWADNLDELVEMTGQTEDEATALIMKAREHWFDQDQA